MQASRTVSAEALGQVTPTSENTPLARGVLGAQRAAIGSRNFEPSGLESQASDELGIREFHRLQQRFADIGFGLYPLSGDSLIATRWGMTRVLHGVGSARAFLAQVGGAHGL